MRNRAIRFVNCALIGLFMLSCKKEKLTNDYSVLVGKWTWSHTEHSYGWCSYEPQYKTITPSDDPSSYGVEFFEKGKVHFLKDGEIVAKYRIVFESFESNVNSEFLFYLRLNNDSDKLIGGGGNNDTLRIEYPYIEENPDCENYLNFFVRE